MGVSSGDGVLMPMGKTEGKKKAGTGMPDASSME
jgi:hypothetical protein